MKYTIINLLGLILICALSSCDLEDTKTDTTIENLLLARWANTDGNSAFVYTFLSDGTFWSARVITSPSTNEVVDYRYYATGVFTLEDNELSLFFQKIYEHDDSQVQYPNPTDLTLTGQTSEGFATISFKNDNQKLTFTFQPCAPNENCATEISFERVPVGWCGTPSPN
ncbi:hypothetical protein [Roseivirga echinicomitans]|uniref:Uncharacterized protein n=1 Tax=Roseivirga echinicomitans TaxID=296218 RepID=A0A150X385_9BACT|nr:hypothetical protein [Roseivirga echinicomitans]KYG73195.1 hypothetical protein AWN68_10970 [Roseivirga echinicomitans]